jgi:hypothetical protein
MVPNYSVNSGRNKSRVQVGQRPIRVIAHGNIGIPGPPGPAGSVRTVNGVSPDENGNIETKVVIRKSLYDLIPKPTPDGVVYYIQEG